MSHEGFPPGPAGPWVATRTEGSVPGARDVYAAAPGTPVVDAPPNAPERASAVAREQARRPSPPRPEAVRAHRFARAAQLVDYAFFLLYSLLGLRMLLALLAARRSAGFVRFIDALTAPFYAPFEDIVASPGVGGHRLALPVLVALLAYALLHGAIKRLLRIASERPAAVA